MAEFLSQEWVSRLQEAVNSSDAYAEAAAGWQGDMAFLVEADLQAGVPEDVHIWMDLRDGRCADARIVSIDEAERADYLIRGPYARWKEILRGQLDPIKAITQGRLRARGDVPELGRYREAARELVRAAGRVVTTYPDER